MKGLSVDILRSSYMSDVMNGIKNNQTEILLVDPEIRGINEPEPDELYLVLVRRIIWRNKPPYIHAELWQNGEKYRSGKHNMFGGSFIYACDSRFREINDYPIPVHDRFE